MIAIANLLRFLALPLLEARILLVDYIDATLAPNDSAPGLLRSD